MKKTLFLCSFLLIISCEDSGTNQRCDIINNQTVFLSNPEFINLQVPAGWAYTNGGIKGIVLYNFNNSFKAFSRECPQLDCANRMNIVNDIKLVCPCDDAEFSILDGSPQTAGVSEWVCEFRVIQANSTVLNITNF